jgi:hypothetical protein
MRSLHVSAQGYPVPWFVAWLSEHGAPRRRGEGTPDFRVIHAGAIETAIRSRVCWLCGEPLGAYTAFVIGPMCAVNRVSSEPGSHLDCANFAARACPFLADPKRRRRVNDLPADGVAPAGVGLARNPGVALVWSTKRFKVSEVGNGVLFDLGDPEQVFWWAEGRRATRAEVRASIDGGLPALQSMADFEGPHAAAALAEAVRRAEQWLPVEVTR